MSFKKRVHEKSSSGAHILDEAEEIVKLYVESKLFLEESQLEAWILRLKSVTVSQSKEEISKSNLLRKFSYALNKVKKANQKASKMAASSSTLQEIEFSSCLLAAHTDLLSNNNFVIDTNSGESNITSDVISESQGNVLSVHSVKNPDNTIPETENINSSSGISVDNIDGITIISSKSIKKLKNLNIFARSKNVNVNLKRDKSTGKAAIVGIAPLKKSKSIEVNDDTEQIISETVLNSTQSVVIPETEFASYDEPSCSTKTTFQSAETNIFPETENIYFENNSRDSSDNDTILLDEDQTDLTSALTDYDAQHFAASSEFISESQEGSRNFTINDKLITETQGITPNAQQNRTLTPENIQWPQMCTTNKVSETLFGTPGSGINLISFGNTCPQNYISMENSNVGTVNQSLPVLNSNSAENTADISKRISASEKSNVVKYGITDEMLMREKPRKVASRLFDPDCEEDMKLKKRIDDNWNMFLDFKQKFYTEIRRIGDENMRQKQMEEETKKNQPKFNPFLYQAGDPIPSTSNQNENVEENSEERKVYNEEVHRILAADLRRKLALRKAQNAESSSSDSD